MEKKIQPSGRTIREVFASMREDFYRHNGYYPTEEEAIKLTDEARKAIREKEVRTGEH